MPLFLHLFFFILYSRYIHTIIHPSFINIRWGPSPYLHSCRLSGRNLHGVPSRDSNSGLPYSKPLRAFSYDAYFHSAHSLTAEFFILRLLLIRRFSFHTFSYDAYFHYTSSPMTLTFIPRILLRRLEKKEGAERKWHLKKFLWDLKCLFSKKIQ